jgi:hypothetical protein
MEKEFVTYGLVIKLKQLGFDEPCMGVYYGDEDDIQFVLDVRETQYYAQKGYKNGVLVPTFSQAFRWFRENYQWTIKVNQVTKNNWSYTLENFPNDRTYYGEVYKSFEVAEIGCLEKLISFIEREK